MVINVNPHAQTIKLRLFSSIFYMYTQYFILKIQELLFDNS